MSSLIRNSLTLHIIISMFLGVAAGLFLGDLSSIFAPWGKSYIMILKITTIPYLLCSVIYGISRLAVNSAKQIFKKGLLFIGAAWAINIGMIYLVVYLFPSSSSSSYFNYSTIEPVSINFAELLIPHNIFASLSANGIPAIVIFGLLIGIALIHLKEKNALMPILTILSETLTKITGWISRITPLGTFFIIADRIGNIELTDIKQISSYLLLYILSLCFLTFWIFPQIVSMFTSVSSGKWIKELAPILLLAFTTNLVIVTLPFMIELIKKKSAKDPADHLEEEIQGIVSIVFNLPLGSLFITIFIFFSAIFYNIDLSHLAQVKLFIITFLTSLGGIGLGSAINSINFILDNLGLPLSAINTYLTMLPLTAGFQSLVSVMEVSSLSLLISFSCHKLLEWKWSKTISKLAAVMVPLAIFTFTFKNWIKLPPISNPNKSIYELSIKSSVKAKIYKEDDLLPFARKGELLERINSSKLLRVGYCPQMVPFAFFGSKGDLIGYDIEFAHQLAYDLGCDLEFVPIDFKKVEQQLNEGIYDIAMSGLSITEERLKQFYFTESYLELPVAFIMPQEFKHLYTSTEAIEKEHSIKLVVRRGTAYELLAHKIVPSSRIVTINHYDEYVQYYPKEILLRGAAQAIAWSLNHNEFALLFPPQPIPKDRLAYGIAQGEEKMVHYMNQWLQLKKNQELMGKEYKKWILGDRDPPPKQNRRWSIIKDVLQWVED